MSLRLHACRIQSTSLASFSAPTGHSLADTLLRRSPSKPSFIASAKTIGCQMPAMRTERPSKEVSNLIRKFANGLSDLIRNTLLIPTLDAETVVCTLNPVECSPFTEWSTHLFHLGPVSWRPRLFFG